MFYSLPQKDFCFEIVVVQSVSSLFRGAGGRTVESAAAVTQNSHTFISDLRQLK